MRISDWSSDVCSSDLVLNRWQAFNVLWRQQWHPASEDERGTRIVAIVVSLVAHLFFAVFLLYVAYVRIMALPEEAASAGEDVIQVERSEERRVGKECVSTCSSRWSPYQ